ncbi:RHS repeat domain-containing protein [Chryseobacterium limigenitum]|uniref:RHS repeat-associated core domain-containing protein n=1 Tax=Chryseobacterium limigenitum TaxID=1612149 RepID=A0A1K2IWF9_9FLAO|nr:RHS repeat-associated core domain-containing protein [Chryseobacterium limigenitum]SFZ96091.1 RHS repeat-associated core domain-containing protein [Chryseobacterium limigenitum]
MYRADGIKLEKNAVNSVAGYNTLTTTIEKTDYLDGFQYYKKEITTSGGGPGGGPEFEMMTARAMEPQAFSLDGPIGPIDPTIDPPFGGGGIIVDAKTPDLQFFPTAEGFYDYQKNQYIYSYTDHLGNVRLSFGRNSTGVLEIVDNNDYYPFGMNHLKTGNAYFGQGSYKSYKFLGQELQESGIYDMNARFYMPDVGRFGTHDPLSESTIDPYGYAYNNPIMFVDPTGLKGEPVIPPNSLGGANNPHPIEEVVVNKSGTINSTPALVMMPSNCLVCNGGSVIQAPMIQNMPPPMVPTQTPSQNWYGAAGKGNWFFGTGAILTGFAGIVQSRQLYKQGVRRGISVNYALKGRNLSQFGKAAMTDATLPFSKIGKIGEGLGTASFFLGVAFDGIGVLNYLDNPNSANSVHPAKFGLNTVMGVVGNWGGPVGASVGTLYFGVDNFYDGSSGSGWPGFFNGVNIDQKMLDEGFNQAGPYRYNIMGAHEPK